MAAGLSSVCADHTRAAANLAMSSRVMKGCNDQKRKMVTSCRLGDLVLWQSASTKMAGVGVSDKSSNRFNGPYRVCIRENQIHTHVQLLSLQDITRNKQDSPSENT